MLLRITGTGNIRHFVGDDLTGHLEGLVFWGHPERLVVCATISSLAR